MAYLKEQDLARYSESVDMQRTADKLIKESKALAQVSVFLSHSHQDRNLVKGLIALLAKSGITLYVDWQDSSMPRVTSRATADRIKEKIEELDVFMILATNRALNSKWVPWETGLADQIKTPSKMVLIPVADSSGRFEGNEYLQLYPHYEIESGELKVAEIGRQPTILNESFLRRMAPSRSWYPKYGSR